MPSEDIDYCSDADLCPEKDNCRRAEKPTYPQYTYYSNFYELEISSGKIECDYFIKKSK